MSGTYPVFLGSQIIGLATLQKQGLYYAVDCRCEITGEILCRVVACGAAGRENLGILAPREKTFGLRTRIAVKRLGEKFVLRVVPRHPQEKPQALPFVPEDPYVYLRRIKNAKA